MITLASGVSYFDLHFVGLPRIIASAVLHGPGGAAIVDPGPSSTLPTLRKELHDAGLSWSDVRALVLTHIHLDHGGACGTLLHEHPHLRVYVHERGIPHMADPEKLIASAARLYGDAMDRLWGEIRPVPRDVMVPLAGGERIEAGGRALSVAYTPGHASHHVSYFAEDAGIAFVGDTAGVRLNPGGFNVPATPPPDVNLEQWRDSLARIARWSADTVFITHFGPHSPSAAHLSETADHLEWAAGLAKLALERDMSDDDRERWYGDELRRELQRRGGPNDVRAYEVAGRFDLSWRGLARYWRKKVGSSQ
jgi:glyoxylase-like metal-dependent hydrolase (beta-lactamase superfamily II)